MSTGVNKVILIGNVGKNPEMRHTQNGTAVVNFSVATSERYTKKDGTDVDSTEWHNIVAWARLAEICNEYLTKGKQVYIEGRIQTRKWEDRDGNTRYTTEVVAQNMQMIGGRGDGGQVSGQRSDSSATDDDIPF